MTAVNWDHEEHHRILAGVTFARARFRALRTLRRIRSPRRLIATSCAILFFSVYLINGIFIFNYRDAADPERLRLWLSGGMVLYAFYHATRCAWSRSVADLELTAAEQLWLGGAPLRRSSLAVYHLSNLVAASLLKTLLIAILLIRDVEHWPLLVTGIFISLVLLENVRVVLERVSAGLDERQRKIARIFTATAGSTLVLQLLALMAASTPLGAPTWAYLLNGFKALGDVAACEPIRFLAWPWLPAASLAVTETITWLSALQFIAAASIIPLTILTLVLTDRWSQRSRQLQEQRRLRTQAYITKQKDRVMFELAEEDRRWLGALVDRLPISVSAVATLSLRQCANVRRYAGTVLFSFTIPAILSLSPLLTGQATQQWLFVIGGIAFCTLLLAPPALRIDFRRDLKRMLLLRALPIKPLGMVLGQILLPITITIAFQAVVIGIAATVTSPGASQVVLWTGILTALAVFAFASENALFLAYPHHEHSEGIAMMIRAKLTFLGKACLIAAALGMLVGWSAICHTSLPPQWSNHAFVAGSIAATWTLALGAVAATTWCWSRFELGEDIPPE